MLPGSPVRPKDFTLVKQDGVYHLFYILSSSATFPDYTENSFGHAASTDLYHWEQHIPVMYVPFNGWDNLHVWAPTIVRRDSLWWMVYTGVTVDGGHNRTQRLGLAVSADLETWNRVGTDPVFDASQTSWAWWNPASTQPAFRDPFVMADPANPGQWLMYYTASLAADTAATVVGVAHSTGDLSAWSDDGFVAATWRANTFNVLTESPHLIRHDGLWYLFITTSSSQPISLYTTPDPPTPSANWTYRGRLRSMLGYDTSTWIASETLADGTHDLYAYVSGDRVELREIKWGTSWLFQLVQPPYFHVVGLDWASPTVIQGDTTSLALRAANPLSGPPLLRAWLVDSLGAETPVAPESLGFASSPALAADTTVFTWIAHRWPAVADSDTTVVMRVRLGTADGTATSAVLTVRGRPTIVPPDTTHTSDDWPEGDAGDPDPLPNPRRVREIFRPIDPEPLGAKAALAVGLPAPDVVRVDLFDVLGRRVRTLADGSLPAGVSVLTWDGRDESGARVARGVYFARLVRPGAVRTARVLLLDR